jgi:hypothetical protein
MNDEASIRSSPGMMKGISLEGAAQELMPGLKALLMRATAMPQGSGNSLGACLLGVVASLRDLGIDIDPSITAPTDVFIAWRRSPAPQGGPEKISQL